MSSPPKLSTNVLMQWVTHAVRLHPQRLGAALIDEFGVSRTAASTALRQLEKAGYVVRQRGGTRPLFAPGPSRQVWKSYPLPKLDESLIWDTDFAPFVVGASNVTNILQHGFTEMVNNANDHSGGTEVTIGYVCVDGFHSMVVADNGIGVFRRIAVALDLPDHRMALLELSKGKFTSDQRNHSGEGIFFTSRLFDRFFLWANQLEYSKWNSESARERLEQVEEQLVNATNHPVGTAVSMLLHGDSARTTREVFERYAPAEPDDFSFNRTTVPVRLAKLGAGTLLSRSQAKRLVARIDQFKFVELDFEGVEEIGQAFADEVFRVFAQAHPGIELTPVHANDYVRAMIRRVQSSIN